MNYTWLCQSCKPEITEDHTCQTANPVTPGLGSKRFKEVDYTGAGSDLPNFVRHYSSVWTDGGPASGLASISPWEGGWRHNFQASLTLREDGSLRAFRPEGTMLRLDASSTATDKWVSPDAQDSVVAAFDASGTRSGYTYFAFADNSAETYDLNGRLLNIKARNGWITTLNYSDASTPQSVAPLPGLLVSVNFPFGRQIRFSYDRLGRLVEMLPPGAVSGQSSGSSTSPTRYVYEEAASLGTATPRQNQLTSVVWPDGHVRRYHYEDARWPQAVTGVTDETGIRYGTYAFDAEGRAVRSELAGGAQRLDFAYSSNASGNPTTVVTDYANGTASSRTYTFTDIRGSRYPKSVTAPCPTCSTTAQATEYDATGHRTREIAHDGSITFYAYNAKGQETERASFSVSYQSYATRPALKFASSVTSTQWHATWNLPTQIARSGQISSYSYNAKGMLTGLSTVTTTDATGAAKFSAPRSGPVRATGYAYNANSLNTTIVEKTDAVETQRWTLAYNASGDLIKITDVTGALSATLTNDAHGRMTRLAGSNGAVATFAANSRGQMLSANTPSGNLSYIYDARNLINEIRFSDGRWVRYSYNAAQKLIEIRDSSGLVEVIAAGEAEGLDPQRLALRVAQWLADRGDRVAQMLVPQAHAQPQLLLVPVAIVWGLMATAEGLRNNGSGTGDAGAGCCGQSGGSGSPSTGVPSVAAASWLTKIGVMLSGQSQPSNQNTAPTYDKAGLLVSPQACMTPPGNCDPGKWRQLQDEVNEQCKSEGRRCEPGMTRIDLTSRLDLNRMCATARDRINKTCFSGGNKSHRDAAIDAWNAVTRYELILLRAP